MTTYEVDRKLLCALAAEFHLDGMPDRQVDGFADAIYRAGFAAGAAEVERLRDLLSESGFELARSLIFVGSRQQMHPDGITLYKQLVDRIDAALAEGKE